MWRRLYYHKILCVAAPGRCRERCALCEAGMSADVGTGTGMELYLMSEQDKGTECAIKISTPNMATDQMAGDDSTRPRRPHRMRT